VRRDHEKGGAPFHSWANQPVQGIVAQSRDVSFSITDEANAAEGIVTAFAACALRDRPVAK
jgi:phage tail sheath protein FI